MRRPGARIAMLIALVSCVGSSRANGVPKREGTRLTLTASAPGGDLPLPSGTSAPAVLRLPIVSVENPSKQGIAVHVTLRGTGLAGSVESVIGTVALYPSDQPGTFTLSIPADAKEQLAQKSSSMRVHVELGSPVTDRPLVPPLSITIGAADLQ
jgi:hypothetical protein